MSHQSKEFRPLTRRAVLTGSLPAAALAGMALEGQLQAAESLDIPLRVFLGSAQDAEPVLDNLDQDPDLVRFVRFTLNPILRQLAAGLDATPPFSGPVPTISLSNSDIAVLHQQLVSFIQGFLEQNSITNFASNDVEEVTALAIQRLQTVLSTPSVDTELAVINQLSDFSAAI